MSDHIQIGDISPRVQHIGDGTQTVFTYPFPIFKDADLEVYADGVLQSLSTDYQITGAGASAGGEVTFVVAPADTVSVTLVRRLAIQRISDFQASGEFRAKVINDELDFQTASLQQIEDDLSRAIRLKRNDGAANLELPLSADRANKLVGFDANGNAKLSDLTIEEIQDGATGPAGPTGPTGPQGADGLFSGLEATVSPASDDFVAIKDVSDSEAAKFASVADVRGGLKSIQVFTSSGTWTKPAGVNLIKVTVVGGGGGGAGSDTGINSIGGGGAAGGTSIKFIDVSAISSVSVTVGDGGMPGGATTNNAGTGGTSSFGTHCSSTGGAGGTIASASSTGGTGGSGSGGDINIDGGDGATGGVGSEGSGHGGASFLGGGGRAVRGTNGDPGRAYGSGGAGGHKTSTNRAGASGKAGVIIIEEYAK